MLEKLSNWGYHLFFGFALLLLLLAFLEKLVNFFGWTMYWLPYEPGRLIELAAMFMVFVIALLLRQVRAALKK